MRSCRYIAIPCAMLFAMTLHAQNAPSSQASLTDGIKQQYNGVKTNLLKAADDMPDDGYTFTPTPEERNFGGWVAHVADSQMGTCSRMSGQQQNLNAAQMTKKADLVAALQKSFDACDAVYNALNDSNAADSVPGFRGNQSRLAALAGNVAHDNECYGSMAVYLRLKAIVPPSTAARGGMRGPGGPGGGGMQGGGGQPPAGGR